MSTSRFRRLVGCIVLVPATLVMASPAGADDDDALPGEGGADIATPGEVADIQVRDGLDEIPAEMSAAAQPTIDDFAYDDLLTEGTAAEVCYGRLRSGTLGAYQALVSRFGGSPGTMYSCRERYAVHERPECNGQVADPARTPDFFSDCWSNHAQGRALDIMVGTSGGGYNQARGKAIVDFLLAADGAGNQNANARRLGVQQILWNDRCWNSDGDRGIRSAATMRPCGYGHFDHVHIDMTLDGAESRTSWWGLAPRLEPKFNGLWFRDIEFGGWEWRSLVNLSAVNSRSGAFPSRFSKVVRGDWDADGVSDDIFAWDPTTGDYRVYDGTTGAQLRAGTASNAVDQFVGGDFDGDGLANDLILFDTETGFGTLWTWGPGGVAGRSAWRWGPGWDRLVTLDGNSDGRVDDTFLYDQETGVWYVFTWPGATPVYLNSGTFLGIWDDLVAGDFDAQGHLDDLFLRDRETGRWIIVNWSSEDPESEDPPIEDPQMAIPTTVTEGTWLREWDHFVIGDWDTDGRLDELFIHDVQGGGWTILSWHRYGYEHVIISSYVPGFDLWLSGTFG